VGKTISDKIVTALQKEAGGFFLIDCRPMARKAYGEEDDVFS